jgi:hypothetical protein
MKLCSQGPASEPAIISITQEKKEGNCGIKMQGIMWCEKIIFISDYHILYTI